jgi:hypothetical protein
MTERVHVSATAVQPSAGLLAGGGSTMVHALVYHHPTPQTPPDSLAELVDPIGGDDGTVHDWRLSLSKLLAHRDDHVHDMWAAFATWRRTFAAEWLLGDVALVTSFIRWADHVTDVTALHALNLPRARIDPRMATRVAWQAHEAETACRGRGELGLGISVPERKGLVRGFVLTEQPLLLLADRGASVAALSTGLELVDPSAPGARSPLLVHGWVVEAEGVTAITEEGPVVLGDSRGGRLLASVAPGVTRASVAPALLTSVFSGLCLALREAGQLAASDRVPLWIRRGHDVH